MMIRRALRWAMQRVVADAPVILMYHRVTELPVDPWGLAVHPDRFREQIDALMRARHVVPLNKLLDMEARRSFRDKPLAAVTFDDGYVDVYSEARPILQAFSCPTTVFVTTGAIGTDREFWWDALARIFLETVCLPTTLALTIANNAHDWVIPPLDETGDREKIFYEVYSALRTLSQEVQTAYIDELGHWANCELTPRPAHRAMTRQELEDLSHDPIMIGPHSVTHPALGAHSPDFQREEILESKRFCEAITRAPVDTFAYPFGDYDDQTLSALRDAGIKFACTTRLGVIHRNVDPLRLPRFQVGNWNGDELLKRIDEGCI
jgi:peptidoglycan/xylan/chitin deacetylase (PgdA/CDA1 family)